MKIPKYIKEIDREDFLLNLLNVHDYDKKTLIYDELELKEIFTKYIRNQTKNIIKGKDLKEIRVIKSGEDHNNAFILNRPDLFETITKLSRYGYVTHYKVCTEKEAQQALKATAFGQGKLFGYIVFGHGSVKEQSIALRGSHKIDADIIMDNYNKEATFIMFNACSAANQVFKNGQMTSLCKQVALKTHMIASGPKWDIIDDWYEFDYFHDKEKDILIMRVYDFEDLQKDLALSFGPSMPHDKEEELVQRGEELASKIKEEVVKKKKRPFDPSVREKQKIFAKFINDNSIPCEQILKWMEKFEKDNKLAILAIKLYFEKISQLARPLLTSKHWTRKQKISMAKKFCFLLHLYDEIESKKTAIFGDFVNALLLNLLISKDIKSGYGPSFAFVRAAYHAGMEESVALGEKMFEKALKKAITYSDKFHRKEIAHFEWLCFQEVCEKLAEEPGNKEYQYFRKILSKHLIYDRVKFLSEEIAAKIPQKFLNQLYIRGIKDKIAGELIGANILKNASLV